MNQRTCSCCRTAIVIGLLFMLLGCHAPQPAIIAGTPPPFSCANFTGSRWAEFRFGIDSPDDVTAAAVRLWEIDSDQVRRVELVNEGLLVSWPIDRISGINARYSALFREKRQLTKIDVRWQPFLVPPTLAQTIDCLGFPQLYEAVYTSGGGEAPFTLRLILWYLGKGIVVVHESPHTQVQQPATHPHLIMDSFIVVAPGSPEQMVPNVYTHGDLSEIQAYGLCVLT